MTEGMNNYCLPGRARSSLEASSSDMSEPSALANLRGVLLQAVAVAIAAAWVGEGYLSSSATSNDHDR